MGHDGKSAGIKPVYDVDAVGLVPARASTIANQAASKARLAVAKARCLRRSAISS
jgi:hypothetical protein